MRVAVVGGSSVESQVIEDAREVGERLGEQGHTVVTGGLGGVMAAASEGAKAADADTIGILPGEERRVANEHVDTAIATGMGHARNALVAMNADAVVALSGGAGTLTEMGYAHLFDTPIAALHSHEVEALSGVEHCESPEEAVAYVQEMLTRGPF